MYRVPNNIRRNLKTMDMEVFSWHPMSVPLELKIFNNERLQRMTTLLVNFLLVSILHDVFDNYYFFVFRFREYAYFIKRDRNDRNTPKMLQNISSVRYFSFPDVNMFSINATMNHIS